LAGLFRAEPGASVSFGRCALAFATAASLSILLPRGRGLFYAVASIVSLERVLENAHYVSEVMPGRESGLFWDYSLTRLILDGWNSQDGG